MNRFFGKIFFSAAFLFFFGARNCSAQDLTGIWRGYFITETGEYYKLEFQVAQNGNYGVSGVSYSYLDVRFYGKATMTGTFVKSSASFRIREIKTVEVKSMLGGATCIMNYNFQYSKSGREEYLEGTYLGKFESKAAMITGQWGDCGQGKVFLRRVNTTDFYVEPFLKNKIHVAPVIVNQPPPRRDTPAITKTTPVITKTIVQHKPTTTTPVKKPVTKVAPPPVTKTVVRTNPPVKKPVTKVTSPPITKNVIKPVTPTNDRADTAKAKTITTPVVKVNLPPVPTPSVIANRSNELVKVLTVSDPHVVVKLYDNGEIDGDTISVYLDKRLVLGSKMLTASPLTVRFDMDDDNQDHELTMVAENLGRIPPNTSLMIVEAGEQRFEVRITSTEQKNAVVRFRYQKPH